MPASRRPHRALAVLVHCLGVLAALPALTAPEQPREPTPTATPTASPAPTPTVRPTRAPALRPTRDAAPRVRVSVAPAHSPAPAYRIEVRNDGATPVDTTVRQELPPGTTTTTVSDGGRTTRPGDGTGPTEVTWRLTLPARSTTTLDTALDARPDQPLTAPACAFAADGDRPYDCATATWRRESTAGSARFAGLPVALVTGVSLVPVLAGTGWWLRRRRRGSAAHRSDPTPQPTGTTRGTLYTRGTMPVPAYRRRRPPTWLVVGSAAAVLVATAGTATWTATSRASGISPGAQPTSGAWDGQGQTGVLGEPLREAAFEFTVYRMACAAGSADQRRCQATVGVRNLTSRQQTWHAELQRAYLPDGRWVNADEPATQAANQGRDVFAEPVAGDQRLVVPVVFTVTGAQPPAEVELRSGVFSAGVRVAVR